ncbi:MAG: hypothetical protein KC731_13705, partial [Myxococcales bacterium]|nr:hypothetical protein [Myxococcales bacterium]
CSAAGVAEMEVEGRVWPVDDEAAVAEAAGPPTFSADDHLGMLHDMARVAHQAGTPLEELEADLADPRFDAAMRALEEQSREGYRRMAHLMPAAARPDGERARMLRTLVETAYEAGESLDGRDLTGANLDASI